MNKFSIFITVLLIFSLTACGNAQVDLIQTNNNDLPAVAKLAIGTLKLKETDQAVTSDQAGELLPLWQIYRELSDSDTAAQAEFEAVIAKVRETMTTNQMQAITDMKLTQQDVSEVAQTQVITSSSSNSSNVNSAPSNGGMPAGGPPDAGGAPLDGGMGGGVPRDNGMGSVVSNISTSQSQTAGASSGLGGTAGIPTVIVDSLIQYLGQIPSS
jgi:hypothetical protein